MKKIYLILAAAVGMTITSCTSNEYLGEMEPNGTSYGNDAITFGSVYKGLTRADHTGKDAATMLNNQFVFAGKKTDASASQLVFDQYYAKWVENTANTTESNSNSWEYVGYSPYGVGNAEISTLPSGATQTIKFWDYSTAQYDFAAYSLGDGSAVASKISFDAMGTQAYTLTGTAENLKKCYISDLVTYYNQGGVNDYGKVVNFSFRSLAAKVRLALYETVPGYSVKSVEFYNAADFAADGDYSGSTATSSAVPTLLTANDDATLPTGEGTVKVTFPTTGFAKRPGGSSEATDYNKAHIAFTNKTASDLSSTMTFGSALADFAPDREGVLDPSGNYLGHTSNTATYADGLENGAGKYFTVLPNEDPKDLMIRIKYTLVATDGSGEQIVVDNATAVIPAELAKWSPNYAYTYIFKISDMTNGSTGVDANTGKVVCGLTPITLNAVVVESEDGVQETITTVSQPSITTYAHGKVVTDNNEYVASTPIYVIVNNGTSNVTLSSTNAKLYTATVESGALQGITEESVDNALRYGVIGTDASSKTTYTVTDAASPTRKNLVVTDITPDAADWLVKKIDAADSPTGNEVVLSTTENKAAKFTPSASTVYVFQYVVDAGTAASISAVPVKTLTNGNTYYTYNSGTDTYSSLTAAGTEKVIAGGTVYYTQSVTYNRVEGTALLTSGKTYYTASDGTGSFTAVGTEDPKTTNYYEEVVTYTVVPYATLTAGTTYYTSNRGAGAFKAAGTEAVDAENKYFTGTLGTEKYQYKIIKVQ